MKAWRRRDVAALVEHDRVHRDVYLSEELFELERRHFFANTWQYLGHASQVPNPGDYLAVKIAGRPLVMVRRADGEIAVLYNRCAHKGTPLVSDQAGNTGRFLRCPYHAWTYRLDGSLAAMPMKEGYAKTRLADSEAARGMTPVRHATHRDFVFVRIGERGPEFEEYFGAVLAAIDNLAERSPVGRLQVAGGVLRNVVHCNWKIYLENINDTVHPISTHEPSTTAARAVWKDQPEDASKPMAIEQILPFAAPYEFFERMGGRTYPNGHSVLGVNFSIHTGYSQVAAYEAAMTAAYGEARAAEILQQSPQNAMCYPSLAVKGSPQVMRVIRPLAVDRTLVEAWSLRAEGAPDLLFERAMTYNRLVFSPMSVVAHDDVHLFEGIQQSLRAEGNEWVSLHRDCDPEERDGDIATVGGTNELLMRNQHRAWAKFMALGMDE
jgi:phenylpropionate dioxygenase-like ring-hydroxylating dioxygenase large terminal subunit